MKCNPYPPIVAQPTNGGSCMSAHLDWRSRTTLVGVWHIRWRGHHHWVRHCVLHCRHCEHFASVLIKGDHTLRTLVTLVIVRMGVRWDGRRWHRWAWARAIRKRILARLWWRHVRLRCYVTRFTVRHHNRELLKHTHAASEPYSKQTLLVMIAK